MSNPIFKNVRGLIGSCLSICFPARASASRLRQIVEKLPDDILIDILSRLGPKDALMCRRVCKEWRDLTSTDCFLILHKRRSIPMILVVFIHPGRQFNQFLVENWKEPAGTRSMIHNIDSNHGYRTESSHGGLIVMQRGMSGNFMILNPTNNEYVKITVTDDLSRSEILGVFYRPYLKDYCTLWRVIVSSPGNPWGQAERIDYRLLNLGSNSKQSWKDIRKNSKLSWKEIKNQWNHRHSYTSSVLVDEYLYWIIAPEGQGEGEGEESSFGIIEFCINTEEITLMPCPVAGILRNNFDISLKLLNVDGALSLVLMSPSTQLVNVNIWTLESRSNWLWKSSDYRFMGEVCSGYRMLVPIVVFDGEVVIDADKRLFVCNLKLGTTRALGNRYDRAFDYLHHMMSLVSLRNCKPIICMDEMGEIDGFT